MKKWFVLLPVLCLCGCAALPPQTTESDTAITALPTSTTVVMTAATTVTTTAVTSPTYVTEGAVSPRLCGDWAVENWILSPTAKINGEMTLYADGLFIIRLENGQSVCGKTTVKEENGVTRFYNFPKKDAVMELREDETQMRLCLVGQQFSGSTVFYRDK